MKRVSRAAAAGTILLLPVTGLIAQQPPLPQVVTDPAAVRLEVSDLRRLAEAVRALGAATDTAAVLRERYLSLASPGLRAYVERYDVTAEMIATAIARDPSRYADLDVLADEILARRAEFVSGLAELQRHYPEAVFPPVWFIAAHSGPGGIARPEGAVVAAENYVGRVDDLVPLVIHEVAHFQQALLQGVQTYRAIYEPGPRRSLLALALREGTADFIAWLTTGRHTNPDAERWALEREPELWARFQSDMHGADTGEWMFVLPRTAGQPADVGYWIGYRIARQYYARAADKREAIRELLGLTDFEGFLRASGYGAARLQGLPSLGR